MGHALDPAGDLHRWRSPQPHPVRVSADPDHGLLFWRTGSEGRTGEARGLGDTWPLLRRGPRRDELDPGCGCGAERRLHRGLASEPDGPPRPGRDPPSFPPQPVWLLGAAASRKAYPSSFKDLRGPLWEPLHGPHPGGGRRAVHRALCPWTAHLGGKHGESVAGVSHLLPSQRISIWEGGTKTKPTSGYSPG